MKRLLQINPVLRLSTSTGRIMQEIGEIVIQNGWESYVAYSRGRDGILPCKSRLVPVGGKWSVLWHGVETRLFDRHGLASVGATKKFIEQIKEINPDVIHIHNIHGYRIDLRCCRVISINIHFISLISFFIYYGKCSAFYY